MPSPMEMVNLKFIGSPLKRKQVNSRLVFFGRVEGSSLDAAKVSPRIGDDLNCTSHIFFFKKKIFLHYSDFKFVTNMKIFIS
ncbi:hypothetical protein TNCT_609901 [Trichonephila clavata]|uniref:Uncharacterized protein n=1 Tax=Trichonephila clavata TaxID=2740835 RepID=A0A8X6KSM8_TRICU|nr:hypothetical protein TNCT_609901 [Trichonephila clavata]